MATPLARALFGRLFDNAAMYPPAQAPMEASLALHDAAERAPWGFARGRFLCPGSRLGDLATDLRLLGLDDTALRVGAVVGSPADPGEHSPLDDVVAAVALLADAAPGVHVDLLEVRPRTQDPAALGDEATRALEAAHATGGDTCFVEVAVAGEEPAAIRDRVAAVAGAGRGQGARLGAKVRCGGLEPGMVPTAAQLAAFLVATRRAGLPFKATAGLHHALAEADGDAAVVHHGFASLLLASVASSRADLDEDATAGLLSLGREHLHLDEHEAVVRTDDVEVRLDVEDVAAARHGGFVAFGTCSFTEPAAEAAALIEGDA